MPRFLFRSMLSVLCLCVLGSLAVNAGMRLLAQRYLYTNIWDIPQRTAVLVLGSQTQGRKLSRVLEDRVVGGIALITAGKGRKLLLSGDHSQYYDEVNPMRLYVLQNAPHIAERDIFTDHAGFNTYDSLYRARDVFAVKDLIIVTQEFHAPRTVFLARCLGLNAVVYVQGQGGYSRRTRTAWNIREYFARIKAVLSVLLRPEPKQLGGRMPITGDGRRTWD